MELSNSGPAEKRFPSWLVPIFGYAVSIGCMIWVYRGADWAKDWQLIQRSEWVWIWLLDATYPA